MSDMSTPFSSVIDRPDPGRYLLLPEDANLAAAPADAGRPRVRRYRLARMQGASPAGINPVRRSARDFSHLRLAHD